MRFLLRIVRCHKSSARTLGSSGSTVSIGSTPTTRRYSFVRMVLAKSALDLGTISPSCIDKLGTPWVRMRISMVPMTASASRN